MKVLIRLLALALAIALAATACGGNESDGGAVPTNEGDASQPTEVPDETGDESTEPGSPDMPDSGTAVLEVNENTIEGTIQTCEVTDSSLVVEATGELDGEPVGLTANGSGAGEAWIIQAEVTNSAGEIIYNSANTSTAEVSGSSVVITGEWVWINEDGDMSGGQGVLTATCP